MTTALLLDQVSRRYGDVLAVDGVSLDVRKGSIFGFLGPNGAGKTTSLRMALGLVTPSSGRIEVLGSDRLETVRDRIGFLPEERGLYRRMTPLDAVAFFAGLKGTPERVARQRGRDRLAALGLADAMNRPMRALSKGMAQKVQLVCALAHDPELVILDEPFSGLDPVNQQSLEALIRDLAARGATVVFSTHVMAHAERLCERVALMAKGRKVFDGSLDEARSVVPRRLLLEGTASDADIRALPGVMEVAAEAGGERIVTLNPGAEAHVTLKAAFERGLVLTRFEVREPTLHDAFIILTGAA